MNQKDELLELLNQLPADKLPQAIEAIRSLLQPSGALLEPKLQLSHSDQALQDLLTAMVGGITNSLYDLSTEHERAGGKIIASRLDFSRMKILESWDTYRKKRTAIDSE
jgi:hypothetical protein